MYFFFFLELYQIEFPVCWLSLYIKLLFLFYHVVRGNENCVHPDWNQLHFMVLQNDLLTILRDLKLSFVVLVK